MHHRCPDEETLAAWFDGLLDPADEAAFARDLIGCPDCAELIATLGLVIQSEPPDAFTRAAVPARATQRALDLWPETPRSLGDGARLAVRWLENTLAPLVDALRPLQPAGVAMRGQPAPAGDTLRYAVEVGPVPLEIDLEIDGPQQVSVTIRPLESPANHVLLKISSNGETCAMSTLTAEGTTVPALPAGTYELTLESAGAEVGRLALELDAKIEKVG